MLKALKVTCDHHIVKIRMKMKMRMLLLLRLRLMMMLSFGAKCGRCFLVAEVGTLQNYLGKEVLHKPEMQTTPQSTTRPTSGIRCLQLFCTFETMHSTPPPQF